MKIPISILGLFIAVFFTLSAPSEGVVLSDTCSGITDQVELGECLFNKETFEGNGRTCASCHPPENNFTIDPKFIDTLPAKDKLFVFEDLAHFPGLKRCRDRSQNGLPGGFYSDIKPACTTDTDCGGGDTCESLENGVLMRKFGLILENVDGLNNEGRMRGVPHTLSMNVNIESDDDTRFGNIPGKKRHALGWSGDGAAGVVDSEDVPFTGYCDGGTATMCQGFNKADADAMCATSCDGFAADGSLKAFAIGATIQHFPRDLRRRVGIDFRLPTEEELEAMEAYQLAQGRQSDLGDLETTSFNSALVNEGRDLFFDPTFRCNDCHRNAGANGNNVSDADSGLNQNFNTGIESMPASPHVLELVGAPVDGGFGGGVHGFCQLDTNGPGPGGQASCSGATQALANASCTAGPPVCITVADAIGDGTFNTPPLVEAADTAPFMHNNSVNTLEQALAFYNSAEFRASPSTNDLGLGFLGLGPDGVSAMAAFLRTINSLENIRLATGLFEKAKQEGCSSKIVSLALADTEDAYQVLEGTEYNLYGNAVKLLKKAYDIGKSIKGQEPDFGFNLSGFGGFFGDQGKKCSHRDSRKIKKAISKLEEARNLIVAP